MAIDSRYKMSQERLDTLKEELHYLETTREKEVAELIKEARSFGDLSENSEYDEAKTEQGTSRRSDRVGLKALTISSQEALYSSSFGRLPNGTSLLHLENPSTSVVAFFACSYVLLMPLPYFVTSSGLIYRPVSRKRFSSRPRALFLSSSL